MKKPPANRFTPNERRRQPRELGVEAAAKFPANSPRDSYSGLIWIFLYCTVLFGSWPWSAIVP